MSASRWPMAAARLPAPARGRRPRDGRSALLVDDAKLDRLAAVVAAHWPEAIPFDGIADPALIAQVEKARTKLLEALEIVELTYR
jgi:succinylarginine dihydrolase